MNKWRKILTILLIINICFILWGKVSKVFALDIEWNDTTYTFPDIPDNANSYNIIVKYTNPSSRNCLSRKL